MKIQKLTAVSAALAASLLAINAPRVLAQNASPAPAASAASGGGNQGGGGQGGNNFRQQMMDRLKLALKATDQEWTVIQPLLEKVQTLQRSAMGGRGGFGGRGGRGGQGGQGGQGGGGQGGGQNAQQGGSTEDQALRTALDTESTSPQDIKAKLEAVRAARTKAKGELEQAREDLKKVLSLRQEATLVMMGMLE